MRRESYHYSVPGSSGRYRVILQPPHGWTCTCDGYYYRRQHCKHIQRCEVLFLDRMHGNSTYPHLIDPTQEEVAEEVARLNARIDALLCKPLRRRWLAPAPPHIDITAAAKALWGE